MGSSAPRAALATGLLAALLLALLGAWFVSGWHDVQMRQQQLRQAPHAGAEEWASKLALDLRGELETLIAREARRPYFHYQNLMHDPRASAATAVSPSPLAGGPEHELVRGYFQLDANGRATTPTVNEDVPELSEPERLADNRRFRDQVVRDLSRELSPKATDTRPRPRPVAKPPAQVIEVDPKVYVQNSNANRVYSSQQAALPAAPVPSPLPAPPPEPVTITISPLEWRTMQFEGVPALVAVREVQTPDGPLTQGFVIDRPALTKRAGTTAGAMVAELRPNDSRGAAFAPGWGVTVEPNPEALALAAADADWLARSFLIRFAGVAFVAALAAGLVLMFLIRAEKLARERSQFAAAAAHELRTPLAGLQLYGDMLAGGLGDPSKSHEYSRRISEDAARLGRVVSNMLGFSQLERGNLSVAAEVRPLSEALSEIAERARPALDRNGATLNLDIASGLRARFDRDALARIVGNLLDNAEKYAQTAEDRTIRLSAIDCGTTVEVIVEDRGPGIADKTKLFRAFTRGVTDHTSPAGLGLGLALSQSLARAMGGELSYRPREGGGASFVLQLPIN